MAIEDRILEEVIIQPVPAWELGDKLQLSERAVVRGVKSLMVFGFVSFNSRNGVVSSTANGRKFRTLPVLPDWKPPSNERVRHWGDLDD